VLCLSPPAVWPAVRTHLVSHFPTRDSLIDAVLASCHLPTISDGSLTVNFRGRGLHIDGGLLSVITPPPGAAHTVLVCRRAATGAGRGSDHGRVGTPRAEAGKRRQLKAAPSFAAHPPNPPSPINSMPSRQIARLPAFITRPRLRDVSISPDTFQDWPFSRSQTTALALTPPSDEFIEHLVARGRQDAWAWACAAGLARRPGAPALPPARCRLLRQARPAAAAGVAAAAALADAGAAPSGGEHTPLAAAAAAAAAALAGGGLLDAAAAGGEGALGAAAAAAGVLAGGLL
jgi:hypothetical protein